MSYVPPSLRKPYKPSVPIWGRTILYWRIVLCCRGCAATVARSAEQQQKLLSAMDHYKAMVANAWLAARQQNKGMNRMARKIKRLRAEVVRLKSLVKED
jgi:hypothetical protein